MERGRIRRRAKKSSHRVIPKESLRVLDAVRGRRSHSQNRRDWAHQSRALSHRYGGVTMTLRITTMLAAGLLVASTTLAQRPARNVSPARHPNLAAAQRSV